MSRPDGGKLGLNEVEAATLDLVRGDEKRAAWIRATVMNVAFGLEELGPQLSSTSSGRRTVQIALNFTPEQRATIDEIRGGVGLGTWVRDVALRQASAKLLARGVS